MAAIPLSACARQAVAGPWAGNPHKRPARFEAHRILDPLRNYRPGRMRPLGKVAAGLTFDLMGRREVSPADWFGSSTVDYSTVSWSFAPGAA
jgi:hypothetical protein